MDTQNSTTTIIYQTVFTDNYGKSGGALYINSHIVYLIGNNFSSNKAILGGALYIPDGKSNFFKIYCNLGFYRNYHFNKKYFWK